MKGKLLSAGIDVSKEKLDICLLNNSSEQFTVKNNTEGVGKLISKLKKQNTSDFPIVVESTGDYHILACILLNESNYKVKLINPLITKQFARANIRKVKNDKVDAQLLSDIGKRLQDDFPTFQSTRSDVITKKRLSLLNTLSKKNQSLKRALKSFQSVTSSLDQEEGLGIQHLADAISKLEEAIKEIEKQITKDCSNNSITKKLEKIQGISTKTASKLSAYLNGASFENKKQMVGFAGMDISVRQSGTSIHSNGKLTKRGDPGLRKTLFQAAWGLMMHNDKFKQLYDYHKDSGKHYFTCLTILARKLLHVLFGMIKTNTEFNPTLITIPM